jgi:thiosulfate/3-mercaptopyruvate sulfurtransferase
MRCFYALLLASGLVVVWALVRLSDIVTSPTTTSAAVPPPRPALVLPNVLVDLPWLEAHLDDPRLIIVDARTADQYATGHVPTAIQLNISKFLTASDDDSRHVIEDEAVCRELGQAGIDLQSTVIIYDEGADYRQAAQLFVLLDSYGHRAAVLDGGLAAWQKAGRGLDSSAVLRTPVPYPTKPRNDRIVDKADVIKATRNGDSIIIDARSPDEFHGIKSFAPRAGHIPGAINIASADHLTTTESAPNLCMFRKPDDLLEIYFYLPVDKKIIVYCNSGRRAAVNYLALRMLGRDVSVYDGAWQEWASDASLPIARSSPATQPSAVAGE